MAIDRLIIYKLPLNPVSCPIEELTGAISASLNSRAYYGIGGRELTFEERRLSETRSLELRLGTNKRHNK